MRRFSQLLRLAFSDLLDEWPVAIAVGLAVAAVLAPLLVLSGLQSGVIGEIFDRLRAEPAMRRVTLDATGARRFDEAWFQAMRARPDVAFVMPSTRFAAAQVDTANPTTGRIVRMSLVPSGPGDPVFTPDSPVLENMAQIKVSAAVADALDAKVGDVVPLDVERRLANGSVEVAGIDATIIEVADRVRHGGRVAFVRPELLAAIEAFRDGFAAPEIDFPEGEPRGERAFYPNFRLYARTIEDVAGLANHLRKDQELSVSAQEGRIGSAIELDNNIGAVLRAIIVLGAIGLAGSLSAIQWASASRKRRTVAMLALIGYGRYWLIGFPVIQGLTLALVGAAAGVVLAGGAAAWINQFFAGSFGASGAACRITLEAIVVGVVLVMIFSFLPSVLIGLKFNNLEPSDEIRDM